MTALDEPSRHYSPGDLLARVRRAVDTATHGAGELTIEAVAPLDHLHVRGIDGTRTLARLASVQAGERVVDVGGGLGGPARLLAAHGCRVLAVERDPNLCRAARFLTEALDRGEHVSFTAASGQTMPFRDAVFDVVWIQSVALHVADKQALYRELYRVVRPGGRLALQELGSGPGGPPHFPVPWAAHPHSSFLVEVDTLRCHLTEVGFQEQSWIDDTDECLAWLRLRRDLARAHRSGVPPLGLHVVLGTAFAVMFHNQIRNFEECRLRAVSAVFVRPASG